MADGGRRRRASPDRAGMSPSGTPNASPNTGGMRVGDRVRRAGPSRCRRSRRRRRPAARKVDRRRDQTRRKPTTSVVPMTVLADGDGRPDFEVGGPHDPGQGVPVVPGPVEPTIRRVLPREVLGIAQRARCPQPAVRPGLVEADAERDAEGASVRSGRCRGHPRPPGCRASRGRRGRVASWGAVWRSRRTVARPGRVEHHQGHAPAARPRRRRASARRRADGGRRR